MPEITLKLDDPARAIQAIRYVVAEYLDKQHTEGMVGEGANAPILDSIADSIEEQVKPAIEEPTGDVLLFVFGTVYKRQDNAEWWPYGQIGAGYEWPDLVDECRSTGSALPIVYRREVLRVGVGNETQREQPVGAHHCPSWEDPDGCRCVRPQAAGHNGGCES